jgi:phage terminase small subunit
MALIDKLKQDLASCEQHIAKLNKEIADAETDREKHSVWCRHESTLSNLNAQAKKIKGLIRLQDVYAFAETKYKPAVKALVEAIKDLDLLARNSGCPDIFENILPVNDFDLDNETGELKVYKQFKNNGW